MRRKRNSFLRMPDCLLRFSPVTAGLDARGSLQVYYGAYYVGSINPSGDVWRAWLHDVRLGDFGSIETAKRAVWESYYGPAENALSR